MDPKIKHVGISH